MTRIIALYSLACAACFGLSGAAQAEDDLSNRIFLELNTAQSQGESCTLTFQIINGYQNEISSLIYETVLFDSAGSVNRLTLFDFGSLPPGRPRVRQFSITGMACDGLGRILINGTHACESEGLDAGVCVDGLKLDSRVSIEVLG